MCFFQFFSKTKNKHESGGKWKMKKAAKRIKWKIQNEEQIKIEKRQMKIEKWSRIIIKQKILELKHCHFFNALCNFF